MKQLRLTTEGGRFEAREAIDAVVRPWFAKHTLAEEGATLKDAGVLVGGFQTFEELVTSGPRCSAENPLLTEIDQPDVGRVMTPRVPLQFGGTPVADTVPAPSPGGDTDAVVKTISATQNGGLH